MDKRPIGVFDSGVGGLTVLSVLANKMPNEDYIYLGDTKNVPYGIKSSEEIADLSVEAYKKLKEFDIKALVIGCNTATVHGLEAIQEIADITIIGIIDPGVEEAKKSSSGNILILATEATVNSGLIQDKLKDEDMEIQAIGAPDMVMAVEAGNAKNEKGYEVVKKYLDQASGQEDSVMLSCTHFPAMSENISKYYKNKGKEINLINPANGVVDFVKKQVEPSDSSPGSIKYFATANPEDFKRSGNIVLNGELIIEQVSLI